MKTKKNFMGYLKDSDVWGLLLGMAIVFCAIGIMPILCASDNHLREAVSLSGAPFGVVIVCIGVLVLDYRDYMKN